MEKLLDPTKSIVCLFVLMLIPAAPALAQEATTHEVSGTVTDAETGATLPGVNVVVKGTTIGTATDSDGTYRLEAPSPQDTLVFSFVGYEALEVPIAERPTVNVELVPSVTALGNVVVTALGIERQERSIGYSVQEIEADALMKAPEPTAIHSLVGKVAGLEITTNPRLFSNPGIYLRGKSPLIVVNGVPLSTDAWDLNPADIKSISVLKGPTAAALYGSRGRNGAIQITTKKGVTDGLRFHLTSSTQLQTGFTTLPEVQHQYGPGSYGRYSFGDGKFGYTGINSVDYFIWGPKFRGQPIKQPISPIDPETGERIPIPWKDRGKGNNLENFLRKGVLTSNSLSLASGGEGRQVRFSITHSYQRGQVPNTAYNLVNASIYGGVDLSSKLSGSAYINYSKQHSDNYPRAYYGPWSPIYSILLWSGANYDIRNFRDYWYPGMEGIQQRWVEYDVYSNPWFVAYEQLQGYYADDLTGYAKLNYTFSDALDLQFRSAVNLKYLNRQNQWPVSTTAYWPDKPGGFEDMWYFDFESNTDLRLTFDKQLNEDFDLQTMVGAAYRRVKHTQQYGRTEGGLRIPGLYTLQNSVEPHSSETYKWFKQVLSGYGSLDIGFRDYLYLSLTGRLDKSSALPLGENTYFYPSVSMSAIISDFVNLPGFISFFKVRGSWASVGNDLGVYSYFPTYSAGGRWGPFVPLYSSGTIYDTDFIEPAFSSSIEGGVELEFFNDRLGLDVTHYQTTDGPQVFSLPISEASGYSYRRVSGRKFERRGWEVTLTATPIYTQSFNWNMTLNWSRMREYLKDLYGDATSIGHIDIGERTDQYWGDVFERSPSGQVVYENGLPKYDPYERFVGYIRPNWSAGLTNTLSYNNFTLSFSLAGEYGGNIFNYLAYKLWQGGRHPDSVTPAREDEAVRHERTKVGEGVVVTSGEIVYDGEGNVIKDTREFAPNTTAAFYSDWARSYWPNDENMVVDRTFFKLREVTLTYALPQSLLQHWSIQQASVSLIGSNLLYLAEHRFMDAAQFANDDAGTSLQMPSIRSFGLTLDVTF